MRWLLREACLLTAAAALIVAIEPAWLMGVLHGWLIGAVLLLIGAALFEYFDQMPTDGLLTVHQQPVGTPGRIRHPRDIEGARNFLVAVDYQLYPFLLESLGQIARHRLLVRHSVDVERQPERASELLGDAAFLVSDGTHGALKNREQLERVTSALESL